jgi:hypothetical protein
VLDELAELFLLFAQAVEELVVDGVAAPAGAAAPEGGRSGADRSGDGSAGLLGGAARGCARVRDGLLRGCARVLQGAGRGRRQPSEG